MKKMLLCLALALTLAPVSLAEEPESTPFEPVIPEIVMELEDPEPADDAMAAQLEQAAPLALIEALTLGVGERYAIPDMPDAGALTFSSSKPRCAAVSDEGVITAKKAGKATVTVKAGDGRAASCRVTVVKAPKSVRLSPSEMVLGLDEVNGSMTTGMLTAKVSEGAASGIEFSGYDPAIVDVSADGTVTPLAVGETTVTAATYNGKTAACRVRVVPGPGSIALETNAMTLMAGQSAALSVTPFEASALGLYYESMDPEIVAVDANTGAMTALRAGETWVAAVAFNGVSASCRVTVLPGPVAIRLDSAEARLGVGESLPLDALAVDADGVGMACDLAYSTGNGACVGVSADGTLTGKKKGAATVTVTAPNGVSAICKVTVAKAPKSIKLKSDQIRLLRGESRRITATLPSGSASAIRYSGYDPQIIAVDGNGLVTALNCGTTQITAETYNGKRATCAVKVLLSDEDLAHYRDTHPLIAVAHRGGRGYWPENTLEAFSHSESTGADMIELDARTTLDGVEVVHHDATFTVKGKKYTIAKCKYKALKTAKPELCTLDEALALISSRTKLDIQLELKATADPAKCVETVEKHGMRSRTMYISFEADLLRRVRGLDADAELGYIFSGSIPKKLDATVASLGISALMVKRDLLTQAKIDEWHRQGLRVNVWTVNDADECRRWADMGVDYITSDYPDYAVKAK